ncbi:sugar phosphate nucleotidyltransferase [Anaerovorax odorimutans]|uniref:sugar phosphate nucleotidyltransferase n=1 Tax=Anaerovorax odorimutans TaxID=109327 RepID=UPI000427CCCF|nr:sugar phosphate nucleotidyltransferase [Anaerovorax odorimutans]
MKEPILIVMAAGMGSRYGGLKQIDPVGSEGELIIDFSIYDAMLAGFRKVIFIIKKEIEKDFREIIDNRAGKYIDVEYAFQELDDLPKEYKIPEGRIKPWGTCHAVLSCRHMIDGPFAVINADDFYGAGAFHSMYEFLEKAKDDDKYRYCMIGYQLENTLTENGHVARGICKTDKNGFLTNIEEKTKIMWKNDKIAYTEDEKEWIEIPKGTPVSMNFWGFTPSIMKEMEKRFPIFLDKALKENPLKAEYFLPLAVDELLQENKASVKVLKSTDKWYGVTYKEDRQSVVDAIQSMKDKGLYPDKLWK